MKTLFSITLFRAVVTIAVSAVLAGCAKGDRFLTASRQVLEFAADDVDGLLLEIDASAPWMIESIGMPDWLWVQYNPDNSALINVTARLNESLIPRSSVLSIVSGDGLTLNIPVVQRSMDITFDTSPGEVAPFGPNETATRTLTVTTNTLWQAVVLNGADWISFSPGAGPEPNTDLLDVSVKPTRSLDRRRDILVLQPVTEAYQALSDSIEVVQLGLDLLVTADGMNEETLETAIPATGGEVSMTVQSRFPWDVSTNADPGRVTLDTTSGPADLEYGTPITITVAANPGPGEHTFTLIFSSQGETYQYLCRQGI
jgi:hypothetical protein